MATLLTLAFETSAKAASVALTENGKLLGESYQNTGLTHSQTLMVMAEDVLKQCGKTAQDVQAVAVAEGPGSFTGVRIGVAAAKGYAWGKEIPCYGVSTLEAMAERLGIYQGYICPAMDARRSQVYNALFYVNHINDRKHDNTFVIKFNDCTKEYIITKSNAGRCDVCPFHRGSWCALHFVYEIVPMRTTQVCRYATHMKGRPCGFTEIETLMEDI